MTPNTIQPGDTVVFSKSRYRVERTDGDIVVGVKTSGPARDSYVKFDAQFMSLLEPGRWKANSYIVIETLPTAA